MERRNWTREELILVFNLYCKLPFGQLNQRTTKVIKMAEVIGRTPSAVALKLVNFASFDPYHRNRGVKGMQNAGKLDKEIFEEFSNNWTDLIYESEILLSQKTSEITIEKILNEETEITKREGTEVIRSVKTRVNQNFFRTVVLGNYSNKCAVSGIDIAELLIASHIIPWAANEKERLNPANGICLSSLYDKAFDKGLITLSDDFTLKLSSRLSKMSDKKAFNHFFEHYENKMIKLPDKFLPKQEFLEFHRNNIFQ